MYSCRCQNDIVYIDNSEVTVWPLIQCSWFIGLCHLKVPLWWYWITDHHGYRLHAYHIIVGDFGEVFIWWFGIQIAKLKFCQYQLSQLLLYRRVTDVILAVGHPINTKHNRSFCYKRKDVWNQCAFIASNNFSPTKYLFFSTMEQ